MNPMNKTKTLIVTETLRYEFSVPAAMHETEETLKRFFARHPDPWSEADFAAVTEREFEIEVEPLLCGSFTPTQRCDAAGREEEAQGSSRTSTHESDEQLQGFPFSTPRLPCRRRPGVGGGSTLRTFTQFWVAIDTMPQFAATRQLLLLNGTLQPP